MMAMRADEAVEAAGAGAVLAIALEVAERGGDVADAARTMLKQMGLPRCQHLMRAIESMNGQSTPTAVAAQSLLRGLVRERVWR